MPPILPMPRIALPCLLAASAFAGPVTTVPWNGHTGAVSFTYDDARTSQLPTLVPQLDAMRLKATFFISSTGAGGDFETRKSDWLQVARNGHELTNHTRTHQSMPADPGAATVIGDMAAYLRGLDPSLESVTFAYPNCVVNGKTGVGTENFVARGCGGTRYAWNTQPADWMDIQGLILTPTGTNGAINAINSAKTENRWLVTIIHDVKANPDAYSVTPADNQRMLDAAVAAGLWIDTYQNIAAYYRAHFVMDAVTPNPISSGWSMAWTSPHPKMPKSVKLRVKLDPAVFGNSFTVRQAGVAIPRETDGSYVIDFMKLSLTVTEGSVGVKAPAVLPSRPEARMVPGGIRVEGAAGEAEAIVRDVRGVVVYRGQAVDGFVPLGADRTRGLLFLTLYDRASGASVRARVNAVR